MAKKKKITWKQALQTPPSWKLFIPVIGIIIGVVSLNQYTFFSFSPPAARIKTISQTDLQNVLGESIFIGPPEEKKSAPMNDTISHYWQDILKDKPNYRDAYLLLAIHAYNERNCENVRYYLGKASDIDPNNKELADVYPKLQSCLEKE